MRRAALLLASAAAAAAVPARADDVRASADASAGAGWSSNPFSGLGGNGSGFGQLGLSPQVRILNEKRVIALGGDLFYQKYFNDYRDTASYQAYADYADRLTESTSVHARAGYSSARLGTFGFGGLGGAIGGTLDPVVGAPVVDPAAGVGGGAALLNPGLGTGLIPGAEVGAFGAGQRQGTFNAAGDFSSALSERDSLTGSVFYLRTRFGGRDAAQFGPLGDYDGYGSTLGLNRRLSETTTAGITGSVAAYNYDRAAFDSRVYTVQGTLSRRLSELWTLDAALGASFLDQQTGGSDTTLSGSANLCRRGERSNTCLQAARAVLPTGFAGTRTQTSAGVSWAFQVGEFQNLSLNASYVNLSGGTIDLGPLDDQYALASGGYSRAVGRRLRLSPSIYYRKVFGGQVDRGDDYGGQVSLSYRFGDLR